MKWLAYILILRPLIRRNLRLRERGELPDEWYWADLMACRWGYYTGPQQSGRWREKNA